MNREELVGILRQAYSTIRGCGVEKLDKPGYENTRFGYPTYTCSNRAEAHWPFSKLSMRASTERLLSFKAIVHASTAIHQPRQCGSSKFSSGPSGTIPKGLMWVCDSK